ncbi:MAG: hypothetical protein QOI19_1567 [Thermoleophilaceae bacterium]|nr:hypothetical protein [Thermoleophilaceae bacterium]
MSTPAELLERHKPFLKYDSHEPYFADSAAEWTDNPGNVLMRSDGTVLATAENGLDLGFLGTTYSPNAAAARTDVIGNTAHDYAKQARELHKRPDYANRVYGHVVDDANGDRWLQYWFFYFYNDYNLIGPFIHAGLHEGDWEMIQIRLRADTPDLAVYCQHAESTSRDWRQVDTLPGGVRPIVYVARGSHASYFEPGTQWTGHWFDHADGKRRSPELKLERVEEGDPEWRWIHWPGYWGDTKKTGDNPLDSDSPRGPAAHKQWQDPSALLEEPEGIAAPSLLAERSAPPPAPQVQVRWADGHIAVHYAAPTAPGGEPPIGLVVTINSPDEREPPTTETFPIDAAEGEVVVSAPADPSRTYDVYTSVAAADGLASESVRSDLIPGPPPAG